MPTIDVNETRLHYSMTGSAGPPLVLVHGSWADQSDWELVIDGFARSFQVVAYDRRGHSRGEPAPENDGIAIDASDLAALIEGLGLAPAHVVGLSAGGCIVLRLASGRPDLFRSLSVHEPPLFGLVAGDHRHESLMQDVRARVEAVLHLLEAGDMAGGARQFVDTLALGPGAWETIPPEWRQLMTANAGTFLQEARDPDLFTVDLAALAADQCPTLLTCGDQSPPWVAPVFARLAEALPHAATHTFAGAGHLPMVTHVEEYVSVISAFAASHDAGVVASVSNAGVA